MECLLCHRLLLVTYSFSELFLLKSPSQSLCERCLKNFEKISENHCPRCWKDHENSICRDCKEWENNGVVVRHKAVFTYNKAMHDFFRQYKFLGDYQLAACFSRYFHPEKAYTLVPIPISNKRFRTRGFNQVTAFLDTMNLPYQNLLDKADSAAQSSLTRTQRLATKNSFTIRKTETLPKKVLLIDDIYTTGTTLQQAIFILKEAGITEVKSFSLCR